MANTNCLQGMQCPKCQDEGPFAIACDVVFLIGDDGTEDQIGDNTFEDDSYCECRECNHHATVADFTVAKEDESP